MRDASDGRVTNIELSAKGRRVAERFIESLETQLAELVSRWPAERRHAILDALNEIAEALDGAVPQGDR